MYLLVYLLLLCVEPFLYRLTYHLFICMSLSVYHRVVCLAAYPLILQKCCSLSHCGLEEHSCPYLLLGCPMQCCIYVLLVCMSWEYYHQKVVVLGSAVFLGQQLLLFWPHSEVTFEGVVDSIKAIRVSKGPAAPVNVSKCRSSHK